MKFLTLLALLAGGTAVQAQSQGVCKSFTQGGPPESTIPSQPQPGHCYIVPAPQQQNCGNIVLNCQYGGFCYCPVPGIGCMPAQTYCCCSS